MKCLILLSLLALVACNGAGGEGSSSASCSGQSAFSAWVDNGGLGLDLTGLDASPAFTGEKLAGDLNPLSVTPSEVCIVNAVVSGNDCSGEIVVVSSTRKNPGAFPMTTACADIQKTFTYRKDDWGLRFGVKGSTQISYH